MITAEVVRDILSYDPDTGEFIWKRCGKPALNGKPAGCLDSAGYRVIRIAQRNYYAHRLAWLFITGEWPDPEVDHRDLNKSNNRFSNLRKAEHAQNGKNQGLRSTNSSGHKGVYFNKRQQQWHASITVNGKSIHLGYFEDLDEAATAYARASNDLHRDFGRAA